MEKPEITKLIDDRVNQLMPNYLESKAFTQRKLTDTPNDDLQVTPRGYVNMNGTTANRPRASVIGQFYYDTTINKPVWWSEDGCFKDAAGNVV